MKILNFVKEKAWPIIAILFIGLFLGKGCTSKKISKTNKVIAEYQAVSTHKIDSLQGVIISLEDKVLDSKETEDIMERVMLGFLIYEDDLDRGKTSLSQIKNKIESND